MIGVSKNACRKSLFLRFAHPDIESAFAAMRERCGVEADHEFAEFRQRKPHRHVAPEHAFAAPALSGDHQNETRAAATRAMQETIQSIMRFGLGMAMQIEPGINGPAAARDLLFQPLFQRGDGRRGFRSLGDDGR